MHALVFTDLEGSTALVERLGDAAAAQVWAAHDRCGRALLARHGGREIDHTDGFFALFDTAADAAAFALGYQADLGRLGLSARVGLHVGDVTLRANAAEDVARGAKPVEVEGVAKPLAARVMAHARGGQTLLTQAARQALGDALPAGAALQTHGHFRLKGIAEPVELHELGVAGTCGFMPPADSEKAYRVCRLGDELWRPVREVRHNLAADRDAFVGRDVELRALAQCVDAGARIVSVLGPGGSGKTRLARRFAWAWLGDWPGGVAFCDLSEARSLDGVLGAVAVALDVPLSAVDPVAQLGHAIAARGPCLVVLDNFEQVLDHAAATLGAWAGRAAQAVFVVTSRERLRLQGEQVLTLEPLPLADDAIELFVVRARALRPDFVLGDANRADIARIVDLLDGMPLAIELAAARVGLLSPAQIVERLRDRFALLAGARGAAARQATLKAAIDWSWDLLAPWEQAALAQCSVFEGGFTLAAAEQVLDLEAWPEAPSAMDAVQTLLDKSLLRSWLPAAERRLAVDEVYFGMYVSVHEYAASKLDRSGARTAVQSRHGRYFAGFGTDDAVDALYGHRGARLRQALALELDNLMAACRRALARGDAGTALDSLCAAWEVLDLQGPFAAAAPLATQLLALPVLDGGQRARTLWVGARVAIRSGRLADARAPLTEALALADAAGDRRLAAAVRTSIGAVLRGAGESDAAQAHYESALVVQRELGARRDEGATLAGLGALHGEQGRVAQGQVLYQQALAIQRELGNRVDEANVHNLIAVLLADQGRLADARLHFEASVAISRELGDHVAEGEGINNLGGMDHDQGRLEQAGQTLLQALAIHRQVGNRRFEGYALGDLGRLYSDLARWAEARGFLEQALAITRETGERRYEGANLRSLAELELAQDHDEAARVFYEQAEQALRGVGDRHYLALVLCGRGDIERRAGRRDAAQALLAQAQVLAAAMQAEPTSQIGQKIAALASRLA
jgi:predicted ATPase/class 3 adenylate cyclase